jgi:hypothetical protein
MIYTSEHRGKFASIYKKPIVLACSFAGVIYLHAIKKVAGYAHAMEKFLDTCMPCTQNLLTHMPLRPTLEVTVSTRHVK